MEKTSYDKNVGHHDTIDDKNFVLRKVGPQGEKKYISEKINQLNLDKDSILNQEKPMEQIRFLVNEKGRKGKLDMGTAQLAKEYFATYSAALSQRKRVINKKILDEKDGFFKFLSRKEQTENIAQLNKEKSEIERIQKRIIRSNKLMMRNLGSKAEIPEQKNPKNTFKKTDGIASEDNHKALY